ncbi:MAG: hypothetical protein EOP86_21035 [Verrucomicrobiaceae bacterium]|nr:MAG: hypothetical protein EOP86_21035 [Verrucomicrobiaceae bacterium]
MVSLRDSHFPPTQWTAVVGPCQSAADDASRLAALETLCRNYWYPLYAFTRRSGTEHSEAEDLTQGFFHYLLKRDLLAGADQRLGKLRTFLLTAFQRCIRDIRTRERALKRGGGVEVFALDMEGGEERYAREADDGLSPAQLYDRGWALSVLDAALLVLRRQEEAAGRGAQFIQLEPFINPAATADTGYPEAAAGLGLTEEAARKAVSRLRKKFRVCLRGCIASTLHDPQEALVDDEVTALKAALRPPGH